jgi:hypothetical protein
VAISAPLLTYLPWLWQKLQPFAPRGEIVTACLTRPVLLVLVPVAAVVWAAWATAFAAGAFLAGLAIFAPWALTGKDTGPPARRERVGV